MIRVLSVMNGVLCLLNLGFYAWGDPAPHSLAVGIACGFFMLLTNQEERK